MVGGHGVGPQRLTLAQVLESRWIPHMLADERLKPTTRSYYESGARKLVTLLGGVRLAELRGDDLDTAMASLASRSASTRHKVFVSASKLLADAVRWKLIPFDPSRDESVGSIPTPGSLWMPRPS